jgi:hypothetical protein
LLNLPCHVKDFSEIGGGGKRGLKVWFFFGWLMVDVWKTTSARVRID